MLGIRRGLLEDDVADIIQELARALQNLGLVEFEQGERADARRHLEQGLDTTFQHFDRLVAAQADRQQIALAASLHARLSTYLDLAEKADFPPADVYTPVLRWALGHVKAAVAVGIAFLALSFLAASQLGSEFLPQLDEGTIWVRANFPAGISLNKSAEEATRIRGILEKFG